MFQARAAVTTITLSSPITGAVYSRDELLALGEVLLAPPGCWCFQTISMNI